MDFNITHHFGKNIIEHFAHRSNIYDSFGTWVNNETLLSSIVSMLPTYPQNNASPIFIIDLGAGTGAVTKYIFTKYLAHKKISAVDISPNMLEKILEPEIAKHIASAESLPFENRFFYVAVSRQCLHYVEDLDKAINEIKRVVKEDGVFILSQIVPMEDHYKDYWAKIINFRQPLRKHYFSEKNWVSVFTSRGFRMLNINRFSHRSSVLRWSKKYAIHNDSLIGEYKRLLLDAPEKFKMDYNVLEDKDDIHFSSFWFTAKFIIE